MLTVCVMMLPICVVEFLANRMQQAGKCHLALLMVFLINDTYGVMNKTCLGMCYLYYYMWLYKLCYTLIVQ